MNEEPHASPDDMLDRLDPMLSRGRRLRGIGALLSGLTGAAFLTALWTTEPGPLPDRTRLSFALLILVCLAWTVFGIWTITRRAPLFALDRVVAAWLALTAALLTGTVTTTLAAVRGRGLLPAVAASAALIALTALLTVRARARRTALLRRKAELTTSDPQ
ncbi:hypothetical protein [Actinomadura sp. K4S16]|uniref:hypothetical protein n=1 Tax=Actinomadura sp. K4S16 TaxID=1316147 RepID=UPI0011EBE0E7|nr:hypothetical protein [Actinomadura sp. K4S16]